MRYSMKVELVRELIGRGADVNLQNEQGCNALAWHLTLNSAPPRSSGRFWTPART